MTSSDRKPELCNHFVGAWQCPRGITLILRLQMQQNKGCNCFEPHASNNGGNSPLLHVVASQPTQVLAWATNEMVQEFRVTQTEKGKFTLLLHATVSPLTYFLLLPILIWIVKDILFPGVFFLFDFNVCAFSTIIMDKTHEFLSSWVVNILFLLKSKSVPKCWRSPKF